MLPRLVSRVPATAAEGGCMTPRNLMLSEMILPEIIRVLPSLFDPIRFQGQKAAAGTDVLWQKADVLRHVRSDSLI